MGRLASALLAGFFLAGFAGCVHHHHGRGHASPSVAQRTGPVVAKKGPPPHAPAHGYRHKRRHDGVELVFDSGRGVYVVVGLHDHYFHADRYYRLAGGAWQVSARIDRGWTALDLSSLPPGLAKQRGARGRGKRQHPAKHGY